jgi:hypothetical protein
VEKSRQPREKRLNGETQTRRLYASGDKESSFDDTDRVSLAAPACFHLNSSRYLENRVFDRHKENKKSVAAFILKTKKKPSDVYPSDGAEVTG